MPVLLDGCLAALMSVMLAQATTSVSVPVAPRDNPALAKGTASIKGKVVAASGGRPLRRVQISLSSPELGEAKTVSTNSEGVFDITELPAGRYTLIAIRAGYLRMSFGQRRHGETGRPIELADGQRFVNADFSLARTGAVVGRITDEVGDPMPNATVYPMQWRYYRGQRRLVPVPGGGPFNRTDDTGQYRITNLEPGEYMVMAVTRDSWTDEKNPKERIGFLPTYSGGTASPVDAMAVRVGLGQEATMPEFPMVPGRVGSISGTAVSQAGLPLAGETVSSMQEFNGPGTGSSFGAGSAKIAPDGTFTIRNVPPGEYKLSLRLAGDAERPAEGASAVVNIGGEDLTGVLLVTTPGATLRGRIATDTGEALPREHKMRVSSRAVDPSRTYTSFDQDNGRVRDDLTFELKGVFGTNRLSLSPLPTGWSLRSIEHEGMDLVDTPLDMSGGQQINGIVVLLSKSMPRLRGTLLDDSGTPAEGSAILFPEDQARWADDSRLIKSARPDASGAFEFRNVVPGDYLLAPVEYVRENEWSDPAFLQGLRDDAKRVRVTDSGAQPVALVLKRK
jgi:hypothetical protein